MTDKRFTELEINDNIVEFKDKGVRDQYSEIGLQALNDLDNGAEPFRNLSRDYNIPLAELYITFEDTLDTLEKLRFDNADLIKTNQKLYDDLQETKNLKENIEKENEQLKSTLAYRSNQLALMEKLIDDLGSEEMKKQMEDSLND